MIDVLAQRAAVDASSEQLLIGLAGLDDELAGAPSGLPGWNRAMVVTHLARNADGIRAVLEAAGAGRVGEMYPGGQVGRDANIAAGAARGARELIDDVRVATARLREACGRLEPGRWQATGLTLRGPQPLDGMLIARRREVEVHHVDLLLGYRPDDWPADFVADELVLALGHLPGRLPAGASLELAASDGTGSWPVAAPGSAPAAPARRVTAPAATLLAWLLDRGAPPPGATGLALARWG